MANGIPGGYHAVTPYFTVEDADVLIAFITSVFDGQVIKDDRHDDGTVRHARVRIADSVIMLNQASADYPPNRSQMHLHVDDLTLVHERALEAGATSIMAPNMRPHGDQMAGVVDPCGNTWWVATPS